MAIGFHNVFCRNLPRDQEHGYGNSLLFKIRTFSICRIIQVEYSDMNRRKVEITDVIVFLRKDVKNFLFNVRSIGSNRF